jgi:Tfp pilus assembly pilus retraction ATPase PilT
MDITELLAFSVKNGASDLHLSAGMPPMIRVDGEVRRINLPALEHKEVHRLVYDIMNDKQRRDFEEQLETDFSFEVPGVARFRVNAFNQNRGAGVLHCVKIQTLSLSVRCVTLKLSALHLPQQKQVTWSLVRCIPLPQRRPLTV